MNAECILGNVLHKSIPANQPSQHLLSRRAWRSTEEVILWVVANSAALSAPVSEVSDNLRRSWPSFLWNVNKINIHENKQILLSTDPSSCTTVPRPCGTPYVPWSWMVSSYSQIIFLFGAGWWQWHARHLNYVFSSGKDQGFLGKKWDLNDIYLHFRSSHLGQVAFHIPLAASSLPLGTTCFTEPPGANPRGGNSICKGGWQTSVSSQMLDPPPLYIYVCARLKCSYSVYVCTHGCSVRKAYFSRDVTFAFARTSWAPEMKEKSSCTEDETKALRKPLGYVSTFLTSWWQCFSTNSAFCAAVLPICKILQSPGDLMWKL